MDVEPEVRSVERLGMLERAREATVDVERAERVAQHTRGCRSRESEDRRWLVPAVPSEPAQTGTEPQEGGSEVVAPLRHAMGLIHNGEIDRRLVRRVRE